MDECMSEVHMDECMSEVRHCLEWQDMHTKPHWAPPAKAYCAWVWQRQKERI